MAKDLALVVDYHLKKEKRKRSRFAIGKDGPKETYWDKQELVNTSDQ